MRRLSDPDRSAAAGFQEALALAMSLGLGLFRTVSIIVDSGP